MVQGTQSPIVGDITDTDEFHVVLPAHGVGDAFHYAKAVDRNAEGLRRAIEVSFVKFDLSRQHRQAPVGGCRIDTAFLLPAYLCARSGAPSLIEVKEKSS